MKRKVKPKKNILNNFGMATIIIIAFFGIGFYWYYSQVKKIDYTVPFPSYFAISSPMNGTYTIGGDVFDFKNGEAKLESDNGTIRAKFFANPVSIDLNEDLVNDSVFLITREEGGNIFYYITAAIKNGNNYIHANSVFIGKNIQHVELSIYGNNIIEKYYEDGDDAKDKDNEKIVYLEYKSGILKQVIK